MALALSALLACLLAPSAHACTVTASATGDLGSVSPTAINLAAVPVAKINAGLNCSPSVLVVLGGNYIKAKFHSDNALTLKRSGGGGVLSYTASADSNATVAFTQDKTVDYMQNNLLNALGLLGGSSADFPFFLKLAGGASPAPGTYTDRVTVTWDWYLCPGLGALGACVGTPDRGTAVTSVVNLTLDVSAKGLVLLTVTQTTWDPVGGTNKPKALPGSKHRWTANAYNPDLVGVGVAITLPLPSGELLAFDGDGTGSGALFPLTEGSPASGLRMTYTAPGSTTDDVDFSADNGATWTYVPVVGDAASIGRITHVRLRPQGTMAAGSRFSVSIPTVTR